MLPPAVATANVIVPSENVAEQVSTRADGMARPSKKLAAV
jgi:hypothetical protein